MTHIEIWTLALALAMDCFTVAIAGGVIMKQCKWRPMLHMALFFGLFQALNPLIGWTVADASRSLIESVDHWIAFAILGYLGARMILESFKEEEEKNFNPESLKVILTMAIATSIDALAVGVSFSCMGIEAINRLTYPIAAIGFVSFAMSICGLLLGIKFGRKFARRLRAEMWGGIILIIIGIKVVIEHTYY
ncbi:MAG: manganese efflux pump [Bacteroidaceae bacterium]|nr:manganese efflux pump [Bacteroidaceae bacterium]